MGPELAEKGACAEADCPWHLNIHLGKRVLVRLLCMKSTYKYVYVLIQQKHGYILDIDNISNAPKINTIPKPVIQSRLITQKDAPNSFISHHPRLYVACA